MSNTHSWDDCRPVLVATGAGPPGADARVQAAVEQVWATLTDPEKRAFHDFCCNNARDGRALQVMQKIAVTVEQAMQTN